MLDIYKASAGSGKTFTLALNYIRMLLSDFRTTTDETAQHTMPHRHILAVTFTKKATAEMKERILTELFHLASGEESGYLTLLTQDKDLNLTPEQIRQRAHILLTDILQDYSNFSVSTIDGFFGQVIRRFARELGLPATYELTLDGDEVVQMAIDNLLQRLRNTPPNEQNEWLKDFALQNVADDRKWNPKDEIVVFSKQLLQEQLGKQLPELKAFFNNKKQLNEYREQLQAIQDQYLATHKEPSPYMRKKKNADDELKQYLTAEVILDNLYPLGLIQDVAQEIEQTNKDLNRLPISDINLMLTWLIDHSDTPFIYEKLGQWLHHYMIDEFQDTSTLQWANFRPLVQEAEAANSHNLIVGDVKQSIYRWRNSNWHLLEQVPNQFLNTRQPVMKKNFRSSPTLVNLNNDLFKHYRDYVADRLDHDFGDNPKLAETVRTIYADERLVQEPVKTFEGYVRWQFFEGGTDEVTEHSLNALPPLLNDIRSRGGKLRDVAIIVRKRVQAAQVSAFLTKQGFNVQSADGLKIANHEAIQIIIGVLTGIVQPSAITPDTIIGAQMQQLLARPLTDNDLEQWQQWRELTVYDQVNAIIGHYQLSSLPAATAYLTTFLDTVFRFTLKRSADTQAFLDYWTLHGNKISIPSALNDDTVQVLTIHSSKGLEFDVVIMPFLNWHLAKAGQDSLLWCRPSTPPFNQLPLVPVKVTQHLDNTFFQAEYRQEILNLYIDSLNMTYVAFTRAKREFYAFGQQTPILKDGKPSVSLISHLLHVIYTDHITDGVFAIGEQHQWQQQEPSSPTNTALNEYIFSPIRSRLRRKAKPTETTDLGNRMHEWLSRIIKWSDKEKGWQQIVSEGIAREAQREEMEQWFQQFEELVKETDWFDNNATVIREKDILTTLGNTYRPDRVVINGNNATVIDYKFGDEHKRSYHEQVRGYMSLLRQMGYHTQGWLVYVQLKKLEKVE